MYYLTRTAKQKRAKRHIIARYNSFDEALRLLNALNSPRHTIEIYNGKWEKVR